MIDTLLDLVLKVKLKAKISEFTKDTEHPQAHVKCPECDHDVLACFSGHSD